jgi:hypothetical protein
MRGLRHVMWCSSRDLEGYECSKTNNTPSELFMLSIQLSCKELDIYSASSYPKLHQRRRYNAKRGVEM